MIDFAQSNGANCPSKRSFPSWKLAQTYNNKMLKRGSVLRAKGKKIEKLHVYKCKRCGNFHIGHAVRKRFTYL